MLAAALLGGLRRPALAAPYFAPAPRFASLRAAESLSLRGVPSFIALSAQGARPALPVFTLHLSVRPRLTRTALLAALPSLSQRCHTRPTTVVFELTTTAVIAALGFERAERARPLARVLALQALRRYLLALRFSGGEAAFHGTIPSVNAVWRRLNAPANEVYHHPLTGELVLDVGLRVGPGTTPAGLLQRLEALYKDRVIVDDGLSATELTDAKNALSARFLAQLGAKFSRALWRFSFEWRLVRHIQPVSHSFVRQKRARAIKRRLAKRLVAASGYRFWAVLSCW